MRARKAANGGCAWKTSTRPASHGRAADEILRTLERFGLEPDGLVMRQSERGDAYRATLDAARMTTGRCLPAAARGGRLPTHNSARRPPAPADRSTRVPAATARRREAQRARRACASTTHGRFRRRASGPVRQALAREVGDFVLGAQMGRSPISLRSWSTTRHRASPTSCAASISFAPHRARSSCSACSGCRRRAICISRWPPRRRREALEADRRAAVDARIPRTGARRRPGFLGQAAPAALARAPPRTVLEWAAANWDRARILACGCCRPRIQDSSPRSRRRVAIGYVRVLHLSQEAVDRRPVPWGARKSL